MSKYNTALQSNNTDLQAILNTINELPDASSGVELPELTNEGTAADMFSGKQLIDSDGNVVTGTFTIDSELTTQDDLITQIKNAVDSLPEADSSEPNLQNKTVTPTTSKQTIIADSGYDGLDIVTVNAMPTTTQATPSISVSSSGLITASVTQSAGYVSSGTKSATKQLTTKSATTYTPSTTNQTIAAGTYCSGVQTIKGDANLKSENIVSGVSIFGVAGSATSGGGSSGETNVSTCTVTFDNESISNDCVILFVAATILENGVKKPYSYAYEYGSSGLHCLTIPNVVCESPIYLGASIYMALEYGVYIEIDGSAIYHSSTTFNSYNDTMCAFTAPSVANENCTIYYAYNA